MATVENNPPAEHQHTAECAPRRIELHHRFVRRRRWSRQLDSLFGRVGGRAQ